MTEITNYEKSFVNSLKSYIVEFSNLANFTIVCDNGEQIQCHKLILAARSKYFEAMFRQEPEKSVAYLDFEAWALEITVKSLVSVNENNLEKLQVDELLKLIIVSDYIQIEDLTKEIEILLMNRLNFENIYDIVGVTEVMNVPNLKSKYCQFIKENVCCLDLKNVPKSILHLMASTPTIAHVKDRNGKLFDLIESEIILFKAFNELYPNENWKFTDKSKSRIHAALTMYDCIPVKLRKILIQKYFGSLKNLEILNHNIDYKINYLENSLQEFKIIGKSDSYGFTPWGTDTCEKWSVEGPFRKISIKTHFKGPSINNDVI